jgi:hypothetical protein
MVKGESTMKETEQPQVIELDTKDGRIKYIRDTQNHVVLQFDPDGIYMNIAYPIMNPYIGGLLSGVGISFLVMWLLYAVFGVISL